MYPFFMFLFIESFVLRGGGIFAPRMVSLYFRGCKAILILEFLKKIASC